VIRSIYTKILLWFWVVALGAAAAVSIVANLSGSQPRASLWMSLATGVYARGAVDNYLRGGKPALARYMSEIENSHGIRATLLDPQDQDILGKGLPLNSADLVRDARETGEARFRGGTAYTEAAPIPTPQDTFVLVAQVHPWQAMENPMVVEGLALKFLVALICTGFLCTILARHFAAPIRALQAAAGRIADGDLSVRAWPAIAPRNDELATLARDFDRMAQRIQGLLQKQQQLLGDISHELRSPLTRLNVSLDLLRHGETDAIERMQIEIHRLDDLIGQILTLTRLQVREGQKIVSVVNLRSIVEGIAEDVRLEGKNEEKPVVLSRADDCWLQGDPALLRSCIENVARNAVRYTKPRTEVLIALHRVEERSALWARIVVSDHGDGVPQESLSHLFEPFYRVSQARDLRTGGVGLGLAIAQRVALLYGGRITARNRDSGGLEIEIELPLEDSASRRAASRNTSSALIADRLPSAR
jgi:two-component system, OmpR family, sensor histidine kinase CpxA